MSSLSGLRFDLVPKEDNVIIFLDAHGGDYWPILDELKVIREKKIRPFIIIHDFFVPDEKDNSKAKFGYDSYNGIKLDLNYIKESLLKIYRNYNDNIHTYVYSYSISPTLNSGVIYIEKC